MKSSNAHDLLTDKDYLTPLEVAFLFRVDPKTVTRWAKDGKLPYIRTLGGHRRYPVEAVQKLLDKSWKDAGKDTNKDADEVNQA